MEITKGELVRLLNNDLKREYAAAIQYIQHAAVITEAPFGGIVKELKVHTNEEIQHAMLLADQIVSLGGVPTVEVGKIDTAKDSKEMLEQDLAGEEDAIARYKTRIEQAEELEELSLTQQLRTILATEEEHATDLKEALGK